VITQVQAGPYTIRGISVGGVYTSLYVPELSVMFDVGAPARSFVGAGALFLSHGHVDHIGALASFLGIRALSGKTRPLKVFMPTAIVEHVLAALAAMSKMQRFELEIEAVGMEPGQTEVLRGDLLVRAFRTFHPVPSLGYQLVRRIQKLRPEHAGMTGPEIAARRRAGEALFDVVDKPEIAYATDTLARVLETEPSILESRVLILECTFLDARKSLAATHAGCHIHLDELLAIADRFANEQLVLMHFSQIYKPREVGAILRQRCPPELLSRLVVFAPDRDEWPG
jgi:ribonuclease Z